LYLPIGQSAHATALDGDDWPRPHISFGAPPTQMFLDAQIWINVDQCYGDVDQ
jgi:hypothetical protein